MWKFAIPPTIAARWITWLQPNNALYNAVFRAALDQDLQRLTYVSSSMVFEQAQEYPTSGLRRRSDLRMPK